MLRARWCIVMLAIVSGCLPGRSPPGPVLAPETAPPPVERASPPAPAPWPYPLAEAVADALSGPLEHIGTGPWHGNHRLHACAYRNNRVIVVNVYCAIKDTRAFRVDVFSPTRGRVRIYAEAKVPLRTLARRDYFSFNAEDEPAPGPAAGLAPVALAMSFADLRAYDQARYERFLPACYGGVEVHRPQGGCLRELGPHASVWAARNRAFLDDPPPDWYRLVDQLRALAAAHGRQVE
jgi:hypothetical protein